MKTIGEQRLTLNIRVPAGLIARVEAYRRRQPVLPTLTETVCYLLDKGMGTSKSPLDRASSGARADERATKP